MEEIVGSELCQVCGKKSVDCRTLRLQYVYDMSEISDKLEREEATIRLADGSEARAIFWRICTCKDCRGNFFGAFRRWVNNETQTQTEPNNPERNIPVRVDGRIVMMATEEWWSHTAHLGEPGRVPYRLVSQE